MSHIRVDPGQTFPGIPLNVKKILATVAYRRVDGGAQGSPAKYSWGFDAWNREARPVTVVDLERDPADQATNSGGDGHCQPASYANPDGCTQHGRASRPSPGNA